MIDAKELRLGNWLINEHGREYQVDGHEMYQFDTMPEYRELWHGIPLTPEVLEACEGVKRTPYADWFDWIVCGLNINYNVDENVYFLYEYPEIVFNSLHQLQNLVALTGQELEYKPKV